MLTGLVVLSSYLALYTCYDKARKTLRPVHQLRKVMSSTHTFARELNKILALAGLTLFGLSFMWGNPTALRREAAVCLALHAAYSAVSFYGGNLSRVYADKRVAALVCGQASLLVLMLHAFAHAVVWPRLLVLALALGVTHFVGMEVQPGPYKGTLQCRPYGFMALVVPAVAIAQALMA